MILPYFEPLHDRGIEALPVKGGRRGFSNGERRSLQRLREAEITQFEPLSSVEVQGRTLLVQFTNKPNGQLHKGLDNFLVDDSTYGRNKKITAFQGVACVVSAL